MSGFRHSDLIRTPTMFTTYIRPSDNKKSDSVESTASDPDNNDSTRSGTIDHGAVSRPIERQLLRERYELAYKFQDDI